MPSVRGFVSALAALALAQLIVVAQPVLNHGITQAILHALAAWERTRNVLHPAPPPPVMPAASEPPPAARWSFVDPRGQTSAPAVAADGTLYATTREALVAVASDGRERWRAPTTPDAPFLGPPILTSHGDVATAAGTTVTVRASDGTVRWTHTLTGGNATVVRALTAAHDGGLRLVAEGSGAFPLPSRLLALDDGGRARWSFDLGAHRAGGITPLADGSLLVAIDGTPQRIAADGTRAPDGPMTGAARVLPNGDIHVVRGSSTTLLAPTGEPRWTVDVPGDVPLCNDSGSTIGPDGAVAFACGMRVSVVSGGALRWSATVGERIVAPPAFTADGTVLVGADGVYAFDATGRVRWHTPTTFTWRDAPTPRTELAAVSAGPLVGSDGTIYVGGARNRVYALRPDGSLRWELPLGDDDALVWRVHQLSFLDGALLVGSHGLVAVTLPDAQREVVARPFSYD